MTVKNHKNYFGMNLTAKEASSGLEIPNAFAVVKFLQILADRIIWNYSVFKSGENYDEGKSEIKCFDLNYSIHGEEFTGFENALMQLLDVRFRAQCLPAPGANAAFVSATFLPVDWEFRINYTDGDEFPRRKLINDQYHQLIAENSDVVAPLLLALNGKAIEKDAAFWADAVQIYPGE